MIERFLGSVNRHHLVDTLKQQVLVQGQEELATWLADHCDLQEFQLADVLIAQNGTDNDLFFLLSGEVAIEVNGRPVAVRSANNHVGEMAAIDAAAPRSASVTATGTVVVARLTATRLLEAAASHNEIWRRLSQETARRLRERSKFVKVPNEVPHIFIGSSAEMLPIASALQSSFKYDTINVNVWTSGVFHPGANTIDDLVMSAQVSDFAVLVLGQDDVVEFRGTRTYAPRDNVIFELGLFVGAIGKERTFILKEAKLDLKLPSDILGVNPIEYVAGDSSTLSARIAVVASELKEIVRKNGPK